MTLIEREREFEALDECLEAARGGEGRLVVVQGEAGIGRTSLVRAFVDAARGVKVMAGSCDPLATPRPLGPLLDMADDLAVIGGSPVGADASRDVLFERLHAELTSRSRTNLVVIEDVHWADDATLDLLRFVGRRLSDVHGVVVVTARAEDLPGDHPLRIALGDLATAPGLKRIELRPLTRSGVGALADQIGVTGVDLDRVHDRTRGNPFLVTEALLAGDGDGVPLSIRDELARLAVESDLPPARRSGLHERVVGLLVERYGDGERRGGWRWSAVAPWPGTSSRPAAPTARRCWLLKPGSRR